MDRRAAGALLALAACIACSAAAPTASNQTALDLYEGAPEGCYYNFQHYGEGDRIMTNEPCLNCTCHNRMLMCYLRVCPFTKAIGQDCTVEKRADQCCPIVTCPDVPVDLLTSTSTTSPAEYGATGLGKLDKYGCSMNGKYFPEGSKVPPTPNKPCEHCYCIRNMTTCVMQECTLHVDGCTPIYHKDVCCPVRYSCDHPEDEVPLLDDMSTTVRPTPGFLLTTTTMSPVTQMTQDCVHDDQVFSDGALIKTEKACEHCYCMKGDIVCVVQECGAPMENEGKNCTSLPPREGQCCPDTYICEGDELASDLSTESTIEPIIEKLTTLSPPRRTSIEGSGYRNEPDEASYTEPSVIGSEVEGSGDEQESSKPFGTDEVTPGEGDDDQYIYLTTKAPAYDEHVQTTAGIDKDMIPDMKDKTVEPHDYILTTTAPISEVEEKLTTRGVTDEEILEPNKHTTTYAPASHDTGTTELVDSQNTVPGVIPDEEFAKPHEYDPGTTNAPTSDQDEKVSPMEDEEKKSTLLEKDATTSAPSETSKPIRPTSATSLEESSIAEADKESTKPEQFFPSTTSSPTEEDKESSKPEEFLPGTTSSLAEEEKESLKPEEILPGTTSSLVEEDKESLKPEDSLPGTTSSPVEEDKKGLKPEEFVPGTTISPVEEDKESPKPVEFLPGATGSPAEEDKESSKPEEFVPGTTISPVEEDKESPKPEEFLPGTTSSPAEEDKESPKPEELLPGTTSSPVEEDKESPKPEELIPGTTRSPAEEDKESSTPEHELASITTNTSEEEKLTTEPDLAENTVAVAEKEMTEPQSPIQTTTALPVIDEEITTQKEDVSPPHEYITTVASAAKETGFTTAEPDRGLNTIPSDINEEASSEPTSLGSTTLPEEPKGTEPSIVIEETQTQGVDTKSTTVSELPTLLPESTVTKGDQITITTEPSFRKEDEGIVSTGKPKETEPTTVKSEFVDEGLIPTSAHDDKVGASSDSPTAEDEFTTSIPEYVTEISETIGPKRTTTESTKQTTPVTEVLPEEVSEQTAGQDGDLSSTEKSAEPTPFIETHEEPSRIPGEGDCLLNGVTYRNNTVVPSTNNCHTGCRCASSIIKCDPIICSPPPDYMDNCQSIYDSPDSCCPTFVCDHPRETVPPQSDNQMSGTESPMPSPTIECRGDQCELIEPTKQPTEPSVPCTSESCLFASDHKTEMECGSEGCGDALQEPYKPVSSMEQAGGCDDGKCTSESCANGECQMPQTQVSPTKPCEGKECEKADSVISESPLCTNADDCKTLEIPAQPTPCQGESCNKVDCGNGKCGSDVITPPSESCKDEDSCKPQDIPLPDCAGDESCRRKEVSTTDEKLPNTCEGSNCIKEQEATVAQGVIDFSTESAIPERIPSIAVTAGIVSTEEVTKKPHSEESTKTPVMAEEGEKKIETTDKPVTVEIEETEPQVIIDDETTKPTMLSEEDTEKPEKPTMIDEEITKKPTIAEEEGTTISKTPAEESSDKPIITEDKVTKTPEIIDETSTNLATAVEIEKPSLIDKETNITPVDIEKHTTETPAIVEDGTEDNIIVDEEGKDKPEETDVKVTPRPIEKEGTDKSVLEVATDYPDVMKEDTTPKVIVGDEEVKEKPAINDMNDTEKPLLNEDENKEPAVTEQISTDKIDYIGETETEKSPKLEEEHKTKPVPSEESVPDSDDVEKSSEHPAVTMIEDTEKPAVVVDDIKKPLDEKFGTEEPVTIGEEITENPVISNEGVTDKPIIDDQEKIKKPDILSEVDTKKPFITEIDSTETPEITDEERTAKPAITDESTEKPIDVEKEKPTKPAVIDKEVTELPSIIGEEGTEKPTLIDEESKHTSDMVDQNGTPKPATVEEGTDKPVLTEEGTEESTVPDRGDTDKPTLIDEDVKTDEQEEKDQEKPTVDKEKEKPAINEVDVTEEPQGLEEEGSGTEIPEAPHTEPEKEVKLPEPTVESTEAAVNEIEKETKKPYYESETTQTDDIAHVYTTESSTAEIIGSKQDMPENPEDGDSKVPISPEIVTESFPEQELTTKKSEPEQEKEPISEQDVEFTTTKKEIIDIIKEESSTMGHDFTGEELALTTKAPELHETSEPLEKVTEKGSIGEQEESTDTPKIDSPTTDDSPIIIEPQEGTQTEEHVTSKTEEESATEVYEEDKIKPTQDSHVTETSSTSTEYETSEKVTDGPKVTDKVKPEPELPEDNEIKTDHPDMYSPDKKETETPVYSVTEPTRRFTEIEDPFVTGPDKATDYPIQPTELHIPSATEKINESGDVSSEKPLITDSQETPDKSTESDKPVTKIPEPDNQAPESEKVKPTDEIEITATDIPISVITESQDISHIPEKDVTSYVEKPTTIADYSGYEHKDTIPPEGSTEEKEPDTEISHDNVPTTEKQFIATGSYVTEPQETSTKSKEQEVTPENEEGAIKPEVMQTTLDLDKEEPSITEIQKIPTELPISIEDEHQELPGLQTSSEIPQSLVTEEKESLGEQTTTSSIPEVESSNKPELLTTQSEEISMAPEQEKVQTESPVQTTEPVEVSTKKTEQDDKVIEVSAETVTEKADTLTTLRESSAVTEEIGVTKSSEQTSAQTEVSETTPYLIELEEHTHKVSEDATTEQPVEEEHSGKPVEDISTSLPVGEEDAHKPEEDISTPSPSEEEQPQKPVENVPTASPSEEEEPHKPVEDAPTPSPSKEEQTHKPIEEVPTTSSPEKEQPHKTAEDVPTVSPSEEEQPHKPTENVPTASPSEEEQPHKPVEDVSTVSPSGEEQTHKHIEDVPTPTPSEEEQPHKPLEDVSTSLSPEEGYTPKVEEHVSTVSPLIEIPTMVQLEPDEEPHLSEQTTKKTEEETVTKEPEDTTKSSEEPLPGEVPEKTSESVSLDETTPSVVHGEDNKYTADHKEYTTSAPTQITEEYTPVVVTESEKLPTETDIAVPIEQEISASEKPLQPTVSHETTATEEEFIFSTTKATTVRQGEDVATPVFDDKVAKPEEKPSETSEVPPSSTTTEVSKPDLSDLQPTDELPVPDEDGHFPSSGTSGYGEPDYVEEDQAFGPGTCRYGGKVYVSAQQIPRDDPCDFCFCFRSDIICLQQSCPPPIHGCHEEPIQGFCCPRYECPVSMATTVNVTTTTTTTTTTLPPHFPTHSYKGAAQRRGCQIKGHTYKVGEVVRSSSGPCLHCTCGGDGQMKCDPKACTPEPMLRQMIAAAVSAKRRR